MSNHWYAIYTKPKAEDSVSFLLRNAGIETLAPKIRQKKYVRRKYADVIEQLFPSYIFACFDYTIDGHMIKYTRGIRYIIGKDNPITVPIEIIDAIRERLEGEIIITGGIDFRSGDRVIIREGPFRNFFGVFERNIPGRERALILLEALQCKVDIECRSLDKSD